MDFFNEEKVKAFKEAIEDVKSGFQSSFQRISKTASEIKVPDINFKDPSLDPDGLESNLAQHIPPEVLEAMNTPLGRKKILEWAESVLTHFNNPLYGQASSWWMRVQGEQIGKGVSKYPTPLRSQDWTFSQFLEHAMQENVDQAHYLTALKIKAAEYDNMELMLNEAEKAMVKIADIANDPLCDPVEAKAVVMNYMNYRKELSNNVRMD